ncbi:MAG: sulfatase [Burkholderiales bacterium]|nr:MAG: sulfatase [Burkholderiales bacterium]
MSRPRNVVILMSDEHAPRLSGHAGHPIVDTPNLDRLASMGTRFSAAYTASPICVPARASFATGQPVHAHGCWDNVIAWKGTPRGWHHALRDRGHRVASIGKLHFAGHDGDDYGLTESILPMHVEGGTGDAKMLFREADDVRPAGAKLGREAGPGESAYTLYDRRITAAAQVWLHEAARRRDDRPWVLFVSWVAPHFPLIAPPEHYYRYASQDLPLPKLWSAAGRVPHPYDVHHDRRSCYGRGFDGPADVRRALAGYYGLTSFMDENLGKVLGMLDRTGLWDDCDVLYTSDHGDNLGTRGLWGKCTMYEESAGIPMIAVGEGFAPGATVATPVGHVDVAPWVLRAAGARDAIDELALPGRALDEIAAGAEPGRVAISELHTAAPHGFWMVRDVRHKYVHYLDMPCQLFDLIEDPEELVDLSASPAHAGVLAAMRARLDAVLDPVAVDARALADQAAMLERLGGRDAVQARAPMPFTPAPV